VATCGGCRSAVRSDPEQLQRGLRDVDLYYDERDDAAHEARGSQMLYWLDDLGAKPPADNEELLLGRTLRAINDAGEVLGESSDVVELSS
jgi:hypothetical protein